MSVHAEFSTSRRWVERLGFAFEGAMPGYGPGGPPHHRHARGDEGEHEEMLQPLGHRQLIIRVPTW